MKTLLVGRGLASTAIASALAVDHSVRHWRSVAPDALAAASPAELDGAVRAIDAIVIDLSAHRRLAVDPQSLEAHLRAVYRLLIGAPAGTRVVLVSSLRLFDSYPQEWEIDETWSPKPRPDDGTLLPHLVEIVVRELARVGELSAIILRSGIPTLPTDMGAATWSAVSTDDLAAAVVTAVELPGQRAHMPATRVLHIPGGGRSRYPVVAAADPSFDYRPRHEVSERRDEQVERAAVEWGLPTPGAPVVVLGGRGPLGVSAATAIAADHAVRVADVRSLAEILESGLEQSPGAPNPAQQPEPFEDMMVDITDFDQVRSAMRGARSAVNCTVARSEDAAFAVNTIGALHLMEAALEARVRRIVQTGPQMIMLPETGYGADDRLGESTPRRPGRVPYHLSKYLGQEICRVYAEHYGFEVVCLLFYFLLDPSRPENRHLGRAPWATSWRDAGSAIRAAATVEGPLPPFELLHVNSDAPHGRFPNDAIKRVLGWAPEDSMLSHYRRPDGAVT